MELLPHGNIATNKPANAYDEADTFDEDDKRALLNLVAKYGSSGQDIFDEVRANVAATSSYSKQNPTKVPAALIASAEQNHQVLEDRRNAILRDLAAADQGQYDLTAEANETYALAAMADDSARSSAQRELDLFDIESQTMLYERRPFVGIPAVLSGGGGSSSGYARPSSTLPRAFFDEPKSRLPTTEKFQPSKLAQKPGVGGGRSTGSIDPLGKTARKFQGASKKPAPTQHSFYTDKNKYGYYG